MNNYIDSVSTTLWDFFCSSSSSSSSSSDEEMFFSEVHSKKQRVENFVSEVVDKYSELQFRENFRVSRGTADMIIEHFEQSVYYKANNVGGKKAIDSKSQILAFLWFAGNKTTYREVSNLFDIAISTMYRQLNLVLHFFYEISPKYIRFPETEAEKNAIADQFTEVCGIENIIGCIDGCYIYIRKPANKIRSTYVNRHDLLSITLQGICDSEKRFTDVFIGSPSKIHDARIFRLSFISAKLPAICGSQYHILGDAAYPLRDYLITPFRNNGSLPAAQRRYNYKHAKGRVKIENAFGLLKTRFRQLLRLEFFKVESMCRFVLACCVLHNMCIDRCDIWPQENADIPTQVIAEPETSEGEIPLRRLGERKRNTIVSSL